MRAQLKHFQKRLQTTTVYVTHDQIEAMTLAGRIAIMNKGKIQQLGTPDEIYNNPTNIFVAGFIGSTPMDLIQGSISKGVFIGPGVKVSGLDYADNAKMVLGIRPEDVTIVTKAKAHFTAPLYSLEPRGDQTLVAVRNGDKLIVARAARDYRADIDTPLSMQFDLTRVFIFDGDSGERIMKR
jgi:multiple sugar transport system ATP-binding protein